MDTGPAVTAPDVGAAADAPADAVGAADPVGALPEQDGAVPAADPRTFRILQVASVDVALPDQYPVVTLREVEEQGRELAFRVGMAEGVALRHALDGSEAPRPLTVDLFSETLERLGVEVLAVRLVGRRGAMYLAELDLAAPGGREVLACRPSDGIALALRRRLPAPVLADERLLATTADVAPG